MTACTSLKHCRARSHGSFSTKPSAADMGLTKLCVILVWMDHFYATPASQDSGMRSCLQNLALLAWWKASTIWKGQLSDACLDAAALCPFPPATPSRKIYSLCQIHHAANHIQDILRLPERTRGLLGSNGPPLFGWWIDDMNLSLPFAAPFVHYITPLHCLDEQRVLKTVAGAGVDILKALGLIVAYQGAAGHLKCKFPGPTHCRPPLSI